jgi:glycosyltransferase involved in cell wall biosynthesis
MTERDAQVQLSVIIPVGKRYAHARELYDEYVSGLESVRLTREFIFVLDGPHPQVLAELEQLISEGAANVKAVCLSRPFGESTALMAGVERAAGELILTLPAYHQIDGRDVAKLLAPLETDDVAIGWRWPRSGGLLEKARRAIFHGMVAWVTGMRLHDLGCGARAMRRRVLEELSLYGDQHRLLAVLADRRGFRVTEVALRQSDRDRFEGVYRPREYAHLVLDVFTVFFLVRFTKKPLRFFGMIGATMCGVGALVVLYLVFGRLVFNQSLADRPALLLSSLLVVLGLQLFALGLLAELIIFTQARHLKDYQAAEIIQYPQPTDRQLSHESRTAEIS